jgi:AcrR family transcriptional regulator
MIGLVSMASSVTSRRPRSRRGEGDALRVELLAAADDLLERTGDAAAVSLRAVAAEVGVAPTAVYLHFADRDELMITVVERGFGAFTDHLRAATTGSSALERLINQGVAYIRFAVEHPGHYRLLFSRISLSGDDPELRRRCVEAGLSAFALCIEATQACIDDGTFIGDAGEIAVALWALVHGYADLAIGMGSELLLEPEQTLRSFFAAVNAHG